MRGQTPIYDEIHEIEDKPFFRRLTGFLDISSKQNGNKRDKQTISRRMRGLKGLGDEIGEIG